MSLPVDHLVYGTKDVAASVDDLADRLGVRAAVGGKHLGGGTHNALLDLGGDAYLEIIGPDPEQPPPPGPLAFGLDRLEGPRLVGFAVRASDLQGVAARASVAGYDAGQVREMERTRPDGVVLRWVLAVRAEPAGDGLVPFLIDWKDTPHPSDSAPKGCTLISLRGEHPNPAAVRQDLEALDVDLEVTQGPEPALIAVVDTPNGRVELR